MTTSLTSAELHLHTADNVSSFANGIANYANQGLFIGWYPTMNGDFLAACFLAVNASKTTADKLESWLTASGTQYSVDGIVMPAVQALKTIQISDYSTWLQSASWPYKGQETPWLASQVNDWQQLGGSSDSSPLTVGQPELVKLYLAAFLRAPEKGGYEYWAQKVLSGDSLTAVGDTIFGLDIVKDIYPDTQSNSDFVTAIYHNVFGKSPDAGGLAYWTAQLGSNPHRGDLVLAMINAGLNTPYGTDGKAYIGDRYVVANYQIGQQMEKGIAMEVSDLKSIMASVTTPLSSYSATGNDVSAAMDATDQHIVSLVGLHPTI